MDQQVTINLEEKSLIELKAMAYDFGILVNQYKRNLEIVNQHIVERTSAEQSGPSKENLENS